MYKNAKLDVSNASTIIGKKRKITNPIAKSLTLFKISNEKKLFVTIFDQDCFILSTLELKHIYNRRELPRKCHNFLRVFKIFW